MTWKKFVAALATLSLVATVVFAQGNVADRNSFKGVATGQPQAGVYQPDTTARVLRVDTNGALNTVEQYPQQQYQLIAPSILSTRFWHGAGAVSGYVVADSCAPINVQGYSRLALLVYASNDAVTDSASIVAFGVSVRLHASAVADTQSTYIELPWNRQPSVTTGYANPDTVGTVIPTYARYWVSTGGPGTEVADTTAAPGEFVMVLPTAMATISRFPRGRVIYLTNRDGQSISGNYISFYVRHLNSYDKVSGLPLGTPKEQKVRFRADLVGWR